MRNKKENMSLFFSFFLCYAFNTRSDRMKMAKYIFKVYTEDSIDNVTLDGLQQAELLDIDRFIIQNGGYINLANILAEKLEIPLRDIKRISILNTRKDIEFSIAANNKYLKKLLSELSDNQNIINRSSSYLEMKEYLFQNLESKNYEDFLDNVYTYRNKFKMLLSRYGNVYNQGTYSEEERLNVSNLKQEIEKKLSNYKNYRGLCICRQKSEEFRFSSNKQKPSLNITVRPAVMTKETFKLKQQEFPTIEDETERYNQDNEEFLDPEEYAMMQGDSESEVKRYPRNY